MFFIYFLIPDFALTIIQLQFIDLLWELINLVRFLISLQNFVSFFHFPLPLLEFNFLELHFLYLLLLDFASIIIKQLSIDFFIPLFVLNLENNFLSIFHFLFKVSEFNLSGQLITFINLHFRHLLLLDFTSIIIKLLSIDFLWNLMTLVPFSINRENLISIFHFLILITLIDFKVLLISFLDLHSFHLLLSNFASTNFTFKLITLVLFQNSSSIINFPFRL